MGKNILGSFASIMSCVATRVAVEGSQSIGCTCRHPIGVFTFDHDAQRHVGHVHLFAVMFMLILLRSPGSLRRYMPYLVGLFATLTLIYALRCCGWFRHGNFLKPIVTLTGKDLTFTGRTAIWDILNEHIRLRPFLGSGYGAYWAGATPTSPFVRDADSIVFLSHRRPQRLSRRDQRSWMGRRCVACWDTS